MARHLSFFCISLIRMIAMARNLSLFVNSSMGMWKHIGILQGDGSPALGEHVGRWRQKVLAFPLVHQWECETNEKDFDQGLACRGMSHGDGGKLWFFKIHWHECKKHTRILARDSPLALGEECRAVIARSSSFLFNSLMGMWKTYRNRSKGIGRLPQEGMSDGDGKKP